MKKITMKNSEIELVVTFLMDLALGGKSSRMRTRLVKMLEKQYTEIVTEERQLLVEEFAKRDEEGNIVTERKTMENGEEVDTYLLDNPKKFNEEFAQLLDENFVITADENNENMLQTVANAIFEYDEPIKGVKALQYDRICEIFESFEEE